MDGARTRKSSEDQRTTPWMRSSLYWSSTTATTFGHRWTIEGP